MNQLNRIIFYLTERKKRSSCFGAYKKPVNAIDTGIVHKICNVPIHIYYYTTKNALVYTPAGIHTSYSNKYEGQHHPMCKIESPGYINYIFNEGGIKWEGSEVIFSTESDSNDPRNYNDTMLLGVLLACFYSLHQRLHYYIHRIEDLDQQIDYGHAMAPFHTLENINKILGLFRISEQKNCAEQFMENYKPNNLNKLIILFQEIKYLSENYNPERKGWILSYYYEGTPKKSRIPKIIELQKIKPRKLF